MTHSSHSTEDLANPDAQLLLRRIAERLADRFAGIFAAETVERSVFESYASLRLTAKVLHYLPLLAEHFAAEVNPVVVEALAEIGVVLREGTVPAYPKPLTDDVVRAADVVITMGCGDACPVYPGKRYLDWDLADPKGRSLSEVRAIRDDIDSRVRLLLDEVVPSSAAAV